jgi:hypothetical protein
LIFGDELHSALHLIDRVPEEVAAIEMDLLRREQPPLLHDCKRIERVGVVQLRHFWEADAVEIAPGPSEPLDSTDILDGQFSDHIVKKCALFDVNVIVIEEIFGVTSGEDMTTRLRVFLLDAPRKVLDSSWPIAADDDWRVWRLSNRSGRTLAQVCGNEARVLRRRVRGRLCVGLHADDCPHSAGERSGEG